MSRKPSPPPPPQLVPDGLNRSMNSVLPPVSASVLSTSSSGAAAGALEVRRVADLVRLLAETRLEVRQLKAALAERDRELAAERHRGETRTVVEATEPVVKSDGATDAQPISCSSSSSSSVSGSAVPTRGGQRGKTEATGGEEERKRRGPHREHRKSQGHRARQDHHHHHHHQRQRCRDYKDKYASLRVRYERLRLRHEQELGEIRHLVDLIGLEQDHARLAHEQKLLFRSMGLLATENAAAVDAIAPATTSPATGEELKRALLPMLGHQHRSLHRDSIGNSNGNRDNNGSDSGANISALSPQPPAHPRQPESLEVTGISQAASAADRSPLQTQVPAPVAPSSPSASAESPPQHPGSGTSSPLPVGQPVPTSSVSPTTDDDGHAVPGTAAALQQQQQQQQLQQELAMWRDQCLRLLTATQQQPKAQPLPPPSPTRPRLTRESEDVALTDISVDPLPPSPSLAQSGQGQWQQCQEATAAAAAAAPAPRSTAPPRGLFLGVPDDAPNNPYTAFHRTDASEPSAFLGDVRHYESPTSCHWRASGNALPPHVYESSYPSGSVQISGQQADRGQARGTVDGWRQSEGDQRQPQAAPSVALMGRSAVPSSSPTAAATRELSQTRAQLERDIARHDQLLAAIAKLQNTAAEQAARRPASMGGGGG